MQINKKHLCSCVLLFIIINFPSDDFYSLTLIVSSIARFFAAAFRARLVSSRLEEVSRILRVWSPRIRKKREFVLIA